jgi:RNA polymerase sigma-70 factor (ECF subfamily)
MHRIKQGDPQAFRELVELHQQSVIGTCARMLGNLDDAHDLAQLVFLRVWKAAPRYTPTAKFTTWLHTILRNLVFNETRRKSTHRTVPLESPVSDDQPNPHNHPDPSAVRPDQASLENELEAAIDAAIAQLPEQQRLAVVLRRFNDLAYEDIAAVLHTSVPAVKSLLFRARTQLRQSLRDYLDR